MPIRETLNASPAALAELLSNGKRYVIPSFQRDYAWEETEWSELWSDILALHASEGGSNHYLGAVVLQPTGQRGEMNVIDGQQRLVTLSLLALAVIGHVERLVSEGREADDNKERARLLRERFVSTRDSASLQHRSRLRLNATDNPFYQTYLVQGVAPARPAKLQASEARLFGAFRFFSRAVLELLGAEATGAQIAEFLEGTVASRLRFIEIVVEDDETAFSVFETLNARGIALGTADLLKNFVFSVAARGGETDLDQARLLWDQVLRFVPLTEVASLLFHMLAAVVPDLREKRVFSEVKKLVAAPGKPGQDVFTFLRGLQEAAQIYAALDDASDDLWNDFPEARKSIRALSILGAHQYRPVILAAFQRLADRPDRVARVLRNLVTIAVRAQVVRVNTGDIQRASQAVALRIGRGELKSPHAITRALSVITPDDEAFQKAFGQLAIDPKGSRKRWLRYLMAELEAAAGGHPVDFDAADVTIEHILPENPGDAWPAFSAEDRARDLTRLGNLTPLEHALNRQLGAADFERKVVVYATSAYQLTRSIGRTTSADTLLWSPAALRARQDELARLAVQIWRLDAGDPALDG